jgi:antitoxin component YwqK of YwqJK toxin-antitoxin module
LYNVTTMNKHLLITGLGILFLSNTFSQNKVTYAIPRTLPAPIPALQLVNHRQLQIDEHLLRQNDQLIGLHPDGDTLFVSEMKRNQLQGNWKSYYKAGHLLDSGRMQRSVPDGEWKTWYPDGTLRTIRNYHAEKLAYVKNEIRRKEGRSTFFVLTNIARQHMSAAKHLMTGYYSYHALDNTHTGQQPHSLEKRVAQNASQQNYHAPFTECLHHGLYMNYFPDGSAKDSGYYKNGVRDGLWKEWNNEATVLAVGSYKQGRPSGDWKFYNKAGKLLYIQLYSNSGKLKEVVKMKS